MKSMQKFIMKCTECMIPFYFLFMMFLHRIFFGTQGRQKYRYKPRFKRMQGRDWPFLGSAKPMGRPAQEWLLWPYPFCAWSVSMLFVVLGTCCSPTLDFCLWSYSKTYGNKTKLCRFWKPGSSSFIKLSNMGAHYNWREIYENKD